MPNRAKSHCQHPGCFALVGGRFCAEHADDADLPVERPPLTAKRKRSATSGAQSLAAPGMYNYQWQQTSRAYLIENPRCVSCGAVMGVAQRQRYGIGLHDLSDKEKKEIIINDLRGKRGTLLVDHTRAHRGDLSLFWDPDNWQTLCSRCHGRKSIKEKFRDDIQNDSGVGGGQFLTS